MTNPGAAGCFAATRAIKRSCSGSKVAQVRNGAKKKRLEVKIGNWGQSKRVLRKLAMSGRATWRVSGLLRSSRSTALPAWRSRHGTADTGCVQVTQQHRQGVTVTPRHALALGEIVGQMRTLLFFWPTRPHALPGAGGNSRQPFAYGVPPLAKGRFGNCPPCQASFCGQPIGRRGDKPFCRTRLVPLLAA